MSVRLLASVGAALLTGCANLPDIASFFKPEEPAPAARAAVPWGTTPEAAAKAAAAVPDARPQDPGYLIGPEDALEISVWKDDALKGTVLVRPDGGISFPLAGDVPVAGRTIAQVREEIGKRLARFLPEPEVSVSVARVASLRIYVLGRVNKPGDYTVGRHIDVLQALSLAGGTTPFASEEAIRIIRRVDGSPQAIPFDYARIRKGGDLSQNITLKSGDVLLVP